jgi:hypothetical protein
MNVNSFKLLLVVTLLIFAFPMLISAQEESGQQEEGYNPFLTPAQDSKDKNTEDQGDLSRFTKEYSDTLNSLKDASIEDQIKGWETFLEDHPDTIFKTEIRNNLDSLRKGLRDMSERKIAKEVKDRENYANFKEQVKALALADQIAKYDEFIKQNLDNIQIEQIKKDQIVLKDALAKAPVIPAPVPGAPPGTPIAPILPAGKYVDPDQALFMASLPGLFVPGMGCFYAGDTTTGVLLVIVRLAGFGMIAGGAIRSNNALIITGAIAAGASYFIDMAAAPVIARENNEKLGKKAQVKINPYVIASKDTQMIGLALRF